MAGDGTFLVEDFLGAITSQLDRTQDALKLKAVNRPLTYAIKEFDMELKVFVGMDPDGKVTLRPPAANETGASSLRIGFTTITRPMIEENTVEMALTRSPTLAEAGVPDDERHRLERLGVRTTGELERLRRTAGTDGVARMADVPIDRLRQALVFGRPQVRDVRPGPAAPRPPGPKQPPSTPPVAQPPQPPPQPVPRPPAPKPPVARPPVMSPPIIRQPPPRIFVPPASSRLELVGRNMLGGGGPPALRLDGAPLSVAEAEDDRIVVDLPPGAPATGTLEVDHGDGDVDTYELASADPWAPAGA
jgi:hypothetical protein